MAVLYSNNASSALSASITSSATSFSVTTGHGAKFPAISNSDYFYVTLLSTGGAIEIVKVTARSADTFTVVRAQDGTTGTAFTAGDKVELRITKAMLDDYKTDTRAGYLPLSGGTLTGALSGTTATMNGNAAIGTTLSSFVAGWYALEVGKNASIQTTTADNLFLGFNAVYGASGYVNKTANQASGGYFFDTGGNAAIRYAAAQATTGAVISWSVPFTFTGSTGAFNATGAITQAGNQVLHVGNYSSYALPLSGGTLTGSSTVNGANYIRFGANPSWSSTLQVGGDGVNGITRTDSIASVVTTNGNLHLDAGSSRAIYLNWYSGTDGIKFGNGAQGQIASLSSGGAFNTSGAITQNGSQVLHAGNYTNYLLDYTAGAYREIADYSSTNTWYIRSNGRFTWARAHDWTQAFELNLESGTAASNNGWAEFGQRQSNNTAGTWFGTRFVQYTGSTKIDGDIRARNMLLSSDSAGFLSSAWAGGNGYHGYAYTGGNTRFGFSSSGGVVDVYADGNFYATDSSHLVLHAGNYSSYALPLSGGTVSGASRFNSTLTMGGYANSNAYIAFNNAGTYWGLIGNYGTNDWRLAYGPQGSIAGWALSWDASGNVAVNGALTQGGNQVLHAGNYSSYAVPTSAYYYTRALDGPSGSFDSQTDNSWVSALDANAATPFGVAWYNLVNVRHRGGSGDGNVWGGQLAWGMTNYTNRIAFRTHYAGSWYGWVEMLTTSNYSSYALPLSGGTVSGSVTAADVFTGGWFRNNTLNYGLYNQVASNHFYASSAGWWNIGGTNNSWCGLRLKPQGHESQTRGCLYADTSNNVGFLNSGEGWSLRVNNGGDVYPSGIIYPKAAGYYGAVTSLGWTASVQVGETNVGASGSVFVPMISQTSLSNSGYRQHTVFGSYRGQTWGSAFIAVGGNDSYPTVSFYFDYGGTFTAPGNVTAYSDERLKKDWAPLPSDYIERLAQTKSGTYTRIDSGVRQAGSSAQDWLTLLPEVVQTAENDDKTLSLAYGNAALVSAIELAKRVVEQDARIAKLESLISKLIGE